MSKVFVYMFRNIEFLLLFLVPDGVLNNFILCLCSILALAFLCFIHCVYAVCSWRDQQQQGSYNMQKQCV